MLGKLSKILQMVGSVTKGFASIVKMGQQLWKAYKPTKATFKGIEGIIEIERVVIPNPSYLIHSLFVLSSSCIICEIVYKQDDMSIH
jgi:hypothetical protein